MCLIFFIYLRVCSLLIGLNYFPSKYKYLLKRGEKIVLLRLLLSASYYFLKSTNPYKNMRNLYKNNTFLPGDHEQEDIEMMKNYYILEM